MPRVFDKQLGVYYKAYKTDIHKIKKDTSKKYIPLKSIIVDAEILSAFLNVPIWHAGSIN
ncbi:hypothetical protein [uncultured Winogradskyella sp.]|uniref:hypothetical protein n=1 Tax=uncultured Winogradskyella sp. TaxID=395353 RepID=UPI0026130ADF|nr:hypothetical protein [uncultured Winogradskyella sp.]|tara:strand:+ start:2112 stop:2291 length:180 start_codon:yes stop_codon:yes gene_type:complete